MREHEVMCTWALGRGPSVYSGHTVVEIKAQGCFDLLWLCFGPEVGPVRSDGEFCPLFFFSPLGPSVLTCGGVEL